jgi:predicted nucleotidyltransferase component of viral defense system
MKQYNPRQSIELFHLLFLSQLGRKVDKKLYALKGGCNMRFYFKSIRYSEDMDIDIQIINKDTLLKNVNKLLSSIPFNNILQAQGMEISNISTPKQTPTTQRWKIELKSTHTALPLHTKVEFSRREFKDATIYEPIDSQIIRQYSLSPFMANHYSIQSMFRQKVRALALRGQTQSRDIFDLYLLIGSGNHFELDKNTTAILEEAKSKAKEITFEDFKGQVLAYLPEDQQNEYDDESVWDVIVKTVITSMDDYKHEVN